MNQNPLRSLDFGSLLYVEPEPPVIPGAEDSSKPQGRAMKPVPPDGGVLFDNLGLLTVEELARALGKAPKTIRNWVARRTIPFVVVGRTTMFRKRAVEAWLERKERKPCL